MDKPSCGDCRFYHPTGTAAKGSGYGISPKIISIGECRRHAPIAAANSMGAIMTEWPQTTSLNWCGDHEKIETDSG